MPPRINKWISQLYIMVNDNNDKSVLDWLPNKNGFIIKNYTKFISCNGILSKYYPRSSSYATFIRSLSYYNFILNVELSSSNVKVYSHVDKLFQKDCLDNLTRIIRKSSINTNKKIVKTLTSIKKKRVRSNSNRKPKPKTKKINLIKEDSDSSYSSDSDDVNINLLRSNAIAPIQEEITEQEYQNNLIEDYNDEDDEEKITLEYDSDATVLE